MLRRLVREALQFNGLHVDVYRRAYKRSIRLTVLVTGRIRMSVPMRLPEKHIFDFLQTNQEWIIQNQRKCREFREKHPPKRYSEGETFPFLGKKLNLRFICGKRARIFVQREGENLICEIPKPSWEKFCLSNSHPEVALNIARFYADESRKILSDRLNYFSEKMALQPSAVCFRSQKTRWGSCSAKGRISLNWRLVIASLDVMDYVVVHELAHLRHHNHSVAFWNLVATHSPDYLMHRNWLRINQYNGDFLAKNSELHLS